GLDPVWVARVSLPPLGVCCERFELRDRGLLVTDAEIKEVEQRIGVLLPADYRGFLLNYNGVSIHATQHFEDQDGNLIRTPDGVPLSWHQCEWRLDSLQELSRDLAGLVEYDQGFVTDQEIADWLSRFIPVGRDPDLIGTVTLGVAPPDFGHVWIYDS